LPVTQEGTVCRGRAAKTEGHNEGHLTKIQGKITRFGGKKLDTPPWGASERRAGLRKAKSEL